MKKLIVLLFALGATIGSSSVFARHYDSGFYFSYGYPGYYYNNYDYDNYYYGYDRVYKRCWWRHGHRHCRYFRSW